jgi:hypothetical protein
VELFRGGMERQERIVFIQCNILKKGCYLDLLHIFSCTGFIPVKNISELEPIKCTEENGGINSISIMKTTFIGSLFFF